MLFEKKPNLAIKNKNGKTAIDATNNRLIVSLFVQYLTSKPEERDNPCEKHLDSSQKKTNLRILSEKIKIKEPEISQSGEEKKKNKIRILQGPKKRMEVMCNILL